MQGKIAWKTETEMTDADREHAAKQAATLDDGN
jgi:hypothetical protein